MSSPVDQAPWQVRLEWGLAGATRVPADVAVVVDVLSFSTAVTVACARGALVRPCPWRDERAPALAARHGARLAVGRSAAGPGDVSLSPVSLRDADVLGDVVLPSPNGSAIADALSARGVVAAAGCLRNRSAVGAWAREHVAAGRSVLVVPAGERWDDGSLRPAFEDLVGAGAVLDAVGLSGRCSPEALAAVAAYRAARLPWDLRDCSGGRELRAAGFAEDVEVAGETDADAVVPVLADGAFRA